MSRSIVSLLMGCATAMAMAQSPPLHPDPRVDLNAGYGQQLTLHGNFDHQANTLPNELPLAILRGGFLNHDLRQRSAEPLWGHGNTAGAIIEGGLQWIGAACWGGRHQWRPLLRFEDHWLSSTRFTADQYDLTFFGNAKYENRTAALSPSGFEQVRYQTIGGGLAHDSSGTQLRIDLVRGQHFTTLDVRSADLFTAVDGRVLRTTLSGDYIASDTTGRGFDRTHGLGAAFSGRWVFQLGTRRPVGFTVGVEDLGFIAWDANSVRIRKDTLIDYTGWHVQNLFALDGVLVSETALMDTFGLHYEKGRVMRATPYRVYIEAHTQLGAGWRIGVAADHRYMTGYLPQAGVQLSRVFGTRTMVGTSLSHGGFGRFMIGLAAKRRFGNHVQVSICTTQVAALWDERAHGLGLQLGVNLGF